MTATALRHSPPRSRNGLGRPAAVGFAVVALTIALTLSTLHALLPALAGYAERTTNEQAGVVVLLLFTVPFLTPAIRKLVGERAALLAAVGLSAWRVAVLVDQEIPFGVAVVGGWTGLVALSLVLSDRRFAGVAVAGVLAGFALEVVSRSLFATWDPVWQRTAPARIFGIVVSAGLVIAVMHARRTAGPEHSVQGGVGGIGTGVALGALLVLETLFLSSPAVVASSAGVTLPVAAVIVLGGLAAGCLTAARVSASSREGIMAGAGLAVIGALLPTANGAASVVVLVVAGQMSAAIVLLGALDRSSGGSRTRAEIGLASGWLFFALCVLLYQMHFDQPLPFDNRWIIAMAGALTALAAGGGQARGTAAHDREPLRSACALLSKTVLVSAVILPVVLMTTRTTSTVTPAPRVLRIVEWNVRQAVTDDGQLDPEGVARALQASGSPDVVVLAEVARGWPMSGDLDLATWLSRRLGLDFVWGGAADQQFGNVVLSRLPIVDSSVTALPVAGDSQGRSLLRAELALGDGENLTILGTHLQHRNDPSSRSARMEEIQMILDQWEGAPRTVLVGDLNPRQGDPPAYPSRVPRDFDEIRAILDAGFTTAQNLERCDTPTSKRNCSDFIFVTPDLHETTFEVGPSSVSDHRPVTVSVSR